MKTYNYQYPDNDIYCDAFDDAKYSGVSDEEADKYARKQMNSWSPNCMYI